MKSIYLVCSLGNMGLFWNTGRNMGARMGQHFLKGTWAARALVHACSLSDKDTVLEVGPGKGVLTEEILATGARVIAIEKDERLVALLHERFASEIASGALTIVADDIRNIRLERLPLLKGGYTVAANIPYYITGEILRQFLTAQPQPRTMALLVQKEVAERIVGRKQKVEGRETNGKESILSLSVKAYGEPHIAAKVPRGNFSPPPSVDSAILVIERISRDFFSGITEDAFFTLVRAGFSSKRKLLSGNLVEKLGLEKSAVLNAFAACGIEEKVRAERVPLLTWKCLVTHLY